MLRPQGNGLIFSLRRFWWIAAACAVIGTALPLLIGPPASTYQASALVVAQNLEVNQRVLPRLGASVFNSGAVAARVADDPAVQGAPGDLIPERLSVEIPVDSIVLTVEARDADPAVAARMANVAATVLVEQLSRDVAGIGEFGILAEAEVPSEPLDSVALQTLVALGGLAGLIFGLGVIGLLAVALRPVVSADDVERAAAVPLLGIVDLAVSGPGGYPGPRGMRGIAPLTRALAAAPPGRLLLVSPPSAAAARRRVCVLLAAALSALRPVRVEGPDEMITAMQRHIQELRRAGGVVTAPPDPADELTFVDDGSVVEVVDPARTDVSVLVVAPLGIRRRRLQAVASDLSDAGLLGVILTRDRRKYRRAVEGRGWSTARAPLPADTRERLGDLPQPERA